MVPRTISQMDQRTTGPVVGDGPHDPHDGVRWSGTGGHYESWFLRANHPRESKALWIRYTIFSPADGSPAQGELWAIWFDGDRTVAAKTEHAIDVCSFARDRLEVRIADATLDARRARGSCAGPGTLRWRLEILGGGPPLLLLDERLYDRRLPRAKTVIGGPLVRLRGTIEVDGETIAIDDWLGSRNHNWGSRHTDRYAWAQVAGFEDRDDAILECITAKLRFGPLWTPWLTVAVLRLGDRTVKFNALRRSMASSQVEGLTYRFAIGNGSERLVVEIEGDRASFVALRYRNPPGGVKICLNTKIARAKVELHEADGSVSTLTTRNRAAFELLGDDAAGFEPVA